jgi:hypothetical protein
MSRRHQHRGHDGVVEHAEGGRGGRARRQPPLDLPACRAERERQTQTEPGVPRQAFGGVANGAPESRPGGGRDLAHMRGQGGARLCPEGHVPERQPVPDQEPGDRLRLHLGNLRQRLLAPGHLVRDTTLEVAHEHALRLQGCLGGGDGSQGGGDLLEDRLGRLLRGSAGGGPGRVQRGQAVSRRLQVRRPLREYVQQGAGRRAFQVNRPTGLGQHPVDRVNSGAGDALRTQRAQECRDLRRLRGHLRHRDHRPWRRRRGLRRLHTLLRHRRAGDAAQEQHEHWRDTGGPGRGLPHHDASSEWSRAGEPGA